MDWMTILYAAASFFVGVLAKHVASGRPPLVDPGNRRPALDAIRDALRNLLAPSTPPPIPEPPATVPAQPNLRDEMILKALQEFLAQRPPTPPPAAPA